MFKKKNEDEVRTGKKRTVMKLLGSFFVAVILFCVLLGMERSMLSDYEKEAVVVCKAEVSKGTTITEQNVGQYFYKYEVDAKLVGSDCVKDTKELVGKVSVRTLTPQEIIRKDDCTKEAVNYAKLKNPVEGSFTANDAGDIVSGTVRRGDHVNIAVVDKDTLEYVLQLKNVYVLDSFTSTGEHITPEMNASVATMLTIVEEKENLAKFYSALEKGTVIVTKLDSE